jgi:hypothetical protein
LTKSRANFGVITAPSQNEVQIDILQFPELWGGWPDAEGISVYRSRCRPIVFAKAVADAARRVLEADGESGYHEKWDAHPFPAAQYADLVKAIEQDGGDPIVFPASWLSGLGR